MAAALDGASAAGLMDLGPTGWAFTHDLVRRAALDVLSPLETMEAHVRALALVPSDGRPAAVVRRAHHALAAAARSDADALRAVAACRAAARVVAQGFDYERAAELAGSAAALAERCCRRRNRSRCCSSRPTRSSRAGASPMPARVPAGRPSGPLDPVARARAALGLGGVWVDEHRGQAARQRILGLQREALAALPADERGLRAPAGGPARGRGGVRRGRRRAGLRRHGRGAGGRRSARAGRGAVVGPPRPARRPSTSTERLPIAEELIDVASRSGDELRTLFGLLWRTVDLYLAGDGRAERALGELRERADAVGCRTHLHIVAAIDVMR